MRAEVMTWADPYEVLNPLRRGQIQKYNAEIIVQAYELNKGKDPASTSPKKVSLGVSLQGIDGVVPSRLLVNINTDQLVIKVEIDLGNGRHLPVCVNTIALLERYIADNYRIEVFLPRIDTFPNFEGIGLGTGVTYLTERVIPDAIELLNLREKYDIIVSEVADSSHSNNPFISRSQHGIGWTSYIMSQLGYQPAKNFPELLQIKAISPRTLVKLW